MTKEAVGETLQKGQQKNRERRQWKNAKKLTKKRVGKLAPAQGENTEIFAWKALKSANATDWTQQNATKIQILNIL